MPFKKGQEKKGGRLPGSANKLTTSVKSTFEATFNELQNDPKANLTTWGRNNPGFFYQLAAKLIPTELKGTMESTNVTISIVKNKNDEK